MAEGVSESQKLEAAKRARSDVQKLLTLAQQGDVEALDRFVCDYIAGAAASEQKLSEADVLGAVRDGNGRTALHFAATGGHIRCAHAILTKHPAGVNAQDDQGLTPLALALITGHQEAAARLVDAGADVNLGGHDGVRPAHRAAGHGDVPALDVLASRGADFAAQSGAGAPLHWAAGDGQDAAVARLLELGVDPDPKNSQGLTPMVMAAARGCGSVVARLAKAGADSGLVLSGGVTVLHMCADHGCEDAVQALLETPQGRKSALLEDSRGRRPVYLAAMGDHRDLAALLLPHSGLEGPAAGLDEVMARGGELAREHAAGGKEEAKKERQKHESSSTAAAAAAAEGAAAVASSEDKEAAAAAKARGNKRFAAGDHRGAVEAYSEAIALDGADAAFWSNRSAAQAALGENVEALSDAETCRRLRPGWAKACYRMAVARLALQRYEDAALAAWEGLKLDNSNKDLKNLLRKCVEEGRKEHQAKKGGPAP